MNIGVHIRDLQLPAMYRTLCSAGIPCCFQPGPKLKNEFADEDTFFYSPALGQPLLLKTPCYGQHYFFKLFPLQIPLLVFAPF